MRAAPPRQGIYRISQKNRHRRGQGARFAPNPRQLLDTKRVQNWLKRHKRFHLHFIPTSSSWLNLVERFFGLITEDTIRRGVFKSVAELEAEIERYLAN